jgi:hypothetical protein
MSPPRRRTTTNAAISNLYNRVETHDTALRVNFIIRMIPIVIVVLFIMADARPVSVVGNVLVVGLLAYVTYLLWQNDLLRSTIAIL